MSYVDMLDLLEKGEVRAASPDENGHWRVHPEVKEAILEAFKDGKLVEAEAPYNGFVDKHNIMPRSFTPEDKIRLVPGGSAIRQGTYVAPGVGIIPPAYVNIGAYIDEGTMVDSHALVRSCAQIGKNVHLSAAVQIGGVLEPIGQAPVIIEDNAFIGAGAIVVEGIRVRKNAVLAPQVSLSKSVRIYDQVHQKWLDAGADVPEGAIVVPGSRPSQAGASEAIHLYCPVIVKYRDAKSEASLELEEALR